jgi:Arc/MetJ family transcription regulator
MDLCGDSMHIRRCTVKTSIELDENLVREAMELANVKTKREVVDLALRRYVHSGKQKRLLDLEGSGGVCRDYDYKRARSGG